MTEIKVVAAADLGVGATINTDTDKIDFNVVFGEREYRYDTTLNGLELLFREVKNANRPMVLTGVMVNNRWIGDAPRGETYTNPITNTQHVSE